LSARRVKAAPFAEFVDEGGSVERDGCFRQLDNDTVFLRKGGCRSGNAEPDAVAIRDQFKLRIRPELELGAQRFGDDHPAGLVYGSYHGKMVFQAVSGVKLVDRSDESWPMGERDLILA
jgi:hypothetical protein